MPGKALPPFATLRDETVGAGMWSLGDRGAPLPERIDDWDCATELQLSRTMTIDTTAALREAHLGGVTPLAVVVTARSTSTRIKRVVYNEPVNGGRQVIAFKLDPAELGGTLVLTTEIVTTAELVKSTLGAYRSGSVLWSNVIRVALEGNAARFPVELVSFVEKGLPPAAPWMIEIRDDDLERPAPAAARVLLNLDHTAVRKMAEDPGGTPASTMLADSLQADVAMRLFRLALVNDDLEDTAELEPGSIGEAMASLIARAFPHRDLAGMRAAGRAAIERFEAELLGTMEVYGP